MPYMPEAYATIAGATVLLLVLYVAILQVASRFLGKPEMAAYANVELQQLFISAVIFLIAFGADAMAYGAGMAITGGDPTQVSLSFLHKTINGGIVPAYVQLVSLDMELSFWSSMSMRYGPTAWGFVVKQVPGLEPVISVVRVLSFTLTAFLGTLSAQVVVFYLIEALTPLLLSAGVILRFFPATRDAGIYLIVFAIAFHTVFPLFFALNAQILDEMAAVQSGPGSVYDPYVSLPGNLLGVEIPDFAPSWMAQVVGLVPRMWFLRFAALSFFLEGIASLSMPSLFLPTLTMTLTISFINAVTKFITGKG